MFNKDTHKSLTTATTSDVDGREVDPPRLPNGVRLPTKKKRPTKPVEKPVEKPTEVDPILIRPIGLGFSGASGFQETWRAHTVETSLRGVAWAFETKAEIGPKGDCPCFYSGSFRERGETTRANIGEVWYAFGDFERPEGAPRGFIEGDDEIAILESFHADLGGYVVASSSSHDPLGLHPDERKRGQWRIRSSWQWSRALTYEEHRYAYLAMVRALAVRLGHTDLPECVGHGSDLYTALAEIGADTALTRACQPIYIPRWPSEGVRDQAFVRWVQGPPVDPDPWLAQWREVERRERPARVSSSTTGIPVDPSTVAVDERTTRLELYVAAIPGAPSGQRNQAAWGPCRAAVGLGVDLEAAWPYVAAWGERCSPPMDREELRRRLERAYRDPSISFGDMLGGARKPPPPTAPRKAKGGTPPVNHLIPEVCPRHLPAHDPAAILAHQVTRVVAPTGSGKTTALRPLVHSGQGRDIIATHRQAIARDLSTRLDRPCYLDSEGALTGSCVVSIDSLPRVSIWDDAPVVDLCGPRFFIIDEIAQSIRHMFGNTLKGKRASVLSHAKALVRSTKGIWQDADADAPIVDAFARYCGVEIDHEIVLAFQPDIDVDIWQSESTYTELLQSALEARAAGQGPRLIEHMTPLALTLARVEWIRQITPTLKVLRVCSETIGDPEVQAFLHDPRLIEHYDVIIASPTLGSGFNLDLPDIEIRVFGYAKAHCGSIASDVKQACSRVRHPHGKRWTLWAGGPSMTPRTAEELYQDLSTPTQRTMSKLQDLGTGWGVEYGLEEDLPRIVHDNDAIVRLACEVWAYEEAEANFTGPDSALVRHLAGKGYRVAFHEGTSAPDDPLLAAVQAAKEIALDVDAEEVEAKADITSEEAADLEGRLLTSDQEKTLRKFKIAEYTGLEVDKELVRWWDRGRGGRTASLYADYVCILDGHALAVLAKDYKSMNGGTTLDCRHRWAGAVTLKNLLRLYGIEDGDARKAAREGTVLRPPPVIPDEVLAKVRSTFLLRTPQKIKPMALLGMLLRRLGIRTSSVKVKRDGKSCREYRIDLESIDAIDHLAGAQISRMKAEVPRTTLNLAELHRLGIHPEDWDAMLEILEGEAA